MQRALVVSIHDVAPATQARAAEIVKAVAELGVGCCSLLIVPDYHHQGRSMADADFCEWLRGLAEQGSEIVLHGFYHQRQRRPNESAREKAITRFYTADEGEFFDLEYSRAFDLITEADREFRAQGFRPRGFIAPAWLLGTEAERAAIDAGMTYTTTLRRVRDFVARSEVVSQSLVYSVRSEWRRGVSLGWNRWLFARLTKNPLLRLSLHPPDISHSKIWNHAQETIRRALRDREPTTYETWLTEKALTA
ncbi:MAG TPA: polysaccharide deacetylase family protein [Chthoniobacterales bacterium]